MRDGPLELKFMRNRDKFTHDGIDNQGFGPIISCPREGCYTGTEHAVESSGELTHQPGMDREAKPGRDVGRLRLDSQNVLV